jgi:hypothetical protein
MTYEQQIEARKNGKWIVTTRNNKFVGACNTEKETDKIYRRGYKIYRPLRKITVTKEAIHEMERIRERMKMDGRGY